MFVGWAYFGLKIINNLYLFNKNINNEVRLNSEKAEVIQFLRRFKSLIFIINFLLIPKFVAKKLGCLDESCSMNFKINSIFDVYQTVLIRYLTKFDLILTRPSLLCDKISLYNNIYTVLYLKENKAYIYFISVNDYFNRCNTHKLRIPIISIGPLYYYLKKKNFYRDCEVIRKIELSIFR